MYMYVQRNSIVHTVYYVQVYSGIKIDDTARSKLAGTYIYYILVSCIHHARGDRVTD